jgi:hypothetical protein
MDPVITIIISICMSLMFGFAAAHKLADLAVFKATIDEYQLIPLTLAGTVAALLMVAELLAAILVLVPAIRTYGLMIMAVLLFLYTAGIGINLLRGRRDIDCGCSGPASRHELSGWLVLRNLVMLSLVLLATSPLAQRPANWLDAVVVLFSVMVTSGLYMGMNQMLAQAPRLAALRSSA